MVRKASIGILAAALLLSGALVGVGGTQPAVLEEPTVIELEWNTDAEDTNIRFFPLSEDEPGGEFEAEGPASGQITTKKLTLFDVDGNEVGKQFIECMVGPDTPWICTLVSLLKDGPYTDKGTVVVIGQSHHHGRGPNISSLPVTGGTGAYNNVGGHAIQEGVDGRVTYTLFLEPA
jgi:hypothetical protein